MRRGEGSADIFKHERKISNYATILFKFHFFFSCKMNNEKCDFVCVFVWEFLALVGLLTWTILTKIGHGRRGFTLKAKY